jgi:hypothetical protein
MAPMQGAAFFCEESLRRLIRGHEVTLKRRLEQSADLDSFLTEFKVLLDSILSVSIRDLLHSLVILS